jgi:hypothetical protein
MKRVLLTLLALLVVFGLFAVAGYAGYRFGYARGAQTVQNTADGQAPELRRFDDRGPRFDRSLPRRMPVHDFGFERGFARGFGMRGFPGMGFGLFSLLELLTRLAILALIIGAAYWLFTRSGWQLTRTARTTETPPRPVEPEVKE